MIKEALEPNRCAIMQPTFNPWLGYFALILSSDDFVFLDHVQLVKRSWHVRNKIKLNHQEFMLSLPVEKLASGFRQCLNITPLDKKSRWHAQHLEYIEQAYRKAPYFDAFFPRLQSFYSRPYELLVEFTQGLILLCLDYIKATTRVSVSSAMPLDSALIKDQLLAEICEIVGADVYHSALGSADYINRDKSGGAFTDKGLSVKYLDYRHPEYPQSGRVFVSHLGILDAMFNVPADELPGLILSGVHWRSEHQ